MGRQRWIRQSLGPWCNGQTYPAFTRRVLGSNPSGPTKSRDKKIMKHCDDYINDMFAPRCLRFFLLINRLPAVDLSLCREFGVHPTLYATYNGKRVRVVHASRLGVVGITSNLHSEIYEDRVYIEELSDFSPS